jgi:putative MATE family efflux protein
VRPLPPPDRLKRILTLALPIMGGMVSQNLMNVVDTAMVGVLGNTALAAVGMGSFTAFMCQALVLGVSSAVQATAARRKGEGETATMALSLNGGILLVLLASLVLSGPLFLLVPRFFPYLNGDPAVVAAGVPYLQVRVLAIVFVGINFAFRGYWNAVDLSRIYMSTLILMHAANIALNYVLIFGKFGAPALGVTGAGIGTSVATAIGSATYFALGWRHARRNGFLRGLPPRAEFRTLVGLSIPNGIQNLFFSAGFVVFYWIVGQVGTAELAAANVLINVMLVAILPGMGLGLSAATLVGQALGRHDPRDAARWAWDVVKVGVLGLGLLGVPMWAAPELVLSVFIHDPATLALASPVMRLVGGIIAMEGVGIVLMHSLLGAGAAKWVMVVSISTQWGVCLPLAYLVGPVLGLGLFDVWLVQGGYRALGVVIYALLWQRGRWAAIRV